MYVPIKKLCKSFDERVKIICTLLFRKKNDNLGLNRNGVFIIQYIYLIPPNGVKRRTLVIFHGFNLCGNM